MWLHGGLLLRLGLPGFPFHPLIIASKLVDELGADLDCVVTHCSRDVPAPIASVSMATFTLQECTLFKGMYGFTGFVLG
jgi:hypothetical protein